ADVYKRQNLTIRRPRVRYLRVICRGQPLQVSTAVDHPPIHVKRAVFVGVEHDPFPVWRPHGTIVRGSLERETSQRLACEIVQPDLTTSRNREPMTIGRKAWRFVRANGRSDRLFDAVSAHPYQPAARLLKCAVEVHQ